MVFCHKFSTCNFIFLLEEISHCFLKRRQINTITHLTTVASRINVDPTMAATVMFGFFSIAGEPRENDITIILLDRHKFPKKSRFINLDHLDFIEQTSIGGIISPTVTHSHHLVPD